MFLLSLHSSLICIMKKFFLIYFPSNFVEGTQALQVHVHGAHVHVEVAVHLAPCHRNLDIRLHGILRDDPVLLNFL